MQADYQFRNAVVADAPMISRLICEVVEAFIISEYSARGAENMRKIISPSAIAGYIEQGIEYQLACYQGRIVGVLAIKNQSHIYHFFVCKHHQKKKVAYRLWRNWFDLNPQTRVTVSSSKFALAFYRSLGFKQHMPKSDINGIVCYPMVREREPKV